MPLSLEAVRAVRLLSLSGDFATCTERSQGPVRRLGNMFETRRDTAPLGVHGLSFLVEVGGERTPARALFDCGLRGDVSARTRSISARACEARRRSSSAMAIRITSVVCLRQRA